MTHPSLAEQITALAAPLAAALDVSLWGVEVALGGRSVVRIFAEGKDGISIDQCAELSRLIGLTLEVEDIIPEAYVLEVSSPGLERVFFTAAQLAQAVGQRIEVTLHHPHDKILGRRKCRGELVAAPQSLLPQSGTEAAAASPDELFHLRAEEVTRPDEEDPLVEFSFDAVKKAKQILVVPEKNLPGKAPKKGSAKPVVTEKRSEAEHASIDDFDPSVI